MIERLAGRGGMATVYRAHDQQTGRTVALKLLHTDDPSLQEMGRLRREAAVLSSLSHPGIVRFIARGQISSNMPYLAMEWLEGESLSSRLSRSGLTLADTMLLLRKAAEALRLTHAHDIVHRDLKPSNLFLGEGLVEKLTLLDFGVARHTTLRQASASANTLEDPLTFSGMIIGTPGYMSPEQALGQQDITPAADIFSLGCILYECLAGNPPFARDHMAIVLHKLLHETPPPVRSFRPNLPAGLDILISKMLEKDPAHRLRDAGALLETLDTLDLSGAVLDARPPAFAKWRPLSMSEQRHIVALVAWVQSSPVEQATLDPQEAIDAERALSPLSATLVQMGARTVQWANDTLVAVSARCPQLPANDEALLLSRCARVVREYWPEAMVTLVTCRCVVGEQALLGEAVERAVQLLRDAPFLSGQSSTPQIYADHITSRLLAGRCSSKPLSPDLFMLIDEREDPSPRLLRIGSQLFPPVPCVGREPERKALRSVLNACIEESVSQALLLVAPIGSGKTRLGFELYDEHAERHDILLLWGRGDVTNPDTPHGLLRKVLRRFCDLKDEDSAEIAAAKLHDRLGGRLTGRLSGVKGARLLAAMSRLCGLHPAGRPGPHTRPIRIEPSIGDPLREPFIDWLQAECEQRPVLFILDDLQYADQASLLLLEAALVALSDQPFMVLGMLNPEPPGARFTTRAGAWQDRAQRVQLLPLSRKASTELVRHFLGDHTSPDTSARIVEQGHGNPLFIEELILALADEKSDETPETILAFLQADLFDLPPDIRRTLRAASIFGQSFRRGGLLSLLSDNTTKRELDPWLDALVEQELIRLRSEHDKDGESIYEFCHPALREAAYRMLTAEDQALGHRAAWRYLESLGPVDTLVLAEHQRRSGERARAVGNYLLAARDAIDRGERGRALIYIDQALSCGVRGETLELLQRMRATLSELPAQD